jgi:hypothetical protein
VYRTPVGLSMLSSAELSREFTQEVWRIAGCRPSYGLAMTNENGSGTLCIIDISLIALFVTIGGATLQLPGQRRLVTPFPSPSTLRCNNATYSRYRLCVQPNNAQKIQTTRTMKLPMYLLLARTNYRYSCSCPTLSTSEATSFRTSDVTSLIRTCHQNKLRKKRRPDTHITESHAVVNGAEHSPYAFP